MSGSKLKFTALLFFSALSAGAPLAPAALASTDKTVSGGTLVGSITCGPDEDKPAARAFVHIDEIGASTSVDGAGRFTIRQVPAARPLTITATSDSGAAATASRYHVAVNAGETLDVGSLDLAVCPPAPTSLDYTNDAPARNFENGDWPSSGWGDR